MNASSYISETAKISSKTMPSDKTPQDITPITKISSINKSAGEEYPEII